MVMIRLVLATPFIQQVIYAMPATSPSRVRDQETSPTTLTSKK